MMIDPAREVFGAAAWLNHSWSEIDEIGGGYDTAATGSAFMTLAPHTLAGISV